MPDTCIRLIFGPEYWNYMLEIPLNCILMNVYNWYYERVKTCYLEKLDNLE